MKISQEQRDLIRQIFRKEGAKGGNKTKAKYGREHFRKIARDYQAKLRQQKKNAVAS